MNQRQHAELVEALYERDASVRKAERARIVGLLYAAAAKSETDAGRAVLAGVADIIAQETA